MTTKRHQQAESLIRGTGARVTWPRIEVLAALLAAEHALTHQELEQRVDRSRDIDRVTIYRVLEWLTAQALAHRIAGDDRTWRFNAVGHTHGGDHAHFKCNGCSTVLCLEEFPAGPTVRLPKGFRSQQVELTVKGLCPGCFATGERKRGAASHGHRH
ncbi:MAG: transcriptional repressor [Burkholderiales bacterium]|nr:transcriptional repressor [Burkholderiales bacterium]